MYTTLNNIKYVSFRLPAESSILVSLEMTISTLNAR